MSSQQTKDDVEEIKRGVPGEKLFDHVDFETWLTSKGHSEVKKHHFDENGAGRKIKLYKLSPEKRRLSGSGTKDENLLAMGVKIPKLQPKKLDDLNIINKSSLNRVSDNNELDPHKEISSDASFSEDKKTEEPGEDLNTSISEVIDHNEINDQHLEESFIEEVPTIIKEEIDTFIESFPILATKYKLLNKIGEGTFSTVYKATPLFPLSTPTLSTTSNQDPNYKPETQKYVALKRIYVTSSPNRIFNELALLNTLLGNPNVAPLLDALRHEDQVIAVLPYYDHADFRDFYRDLPLAGIKFYMFELLKGIQFVHSKGIIHRDIKPTNFLYNPFTRHGVLVDFGLAEKECGPDPHSNCCSCVYGGYNSTNKSTNNGFPTNGYLKDDQRPGRRANRAGTRGFRAPEVLMKCNNQTIKLDIWSAGVMLLTLLGRRFPFFNSTDDVEALMEITSIFGINEMKKCAKLHGLGFECTAPKMEGHSLGELLLFCVSTDAKEGDTFAPDSPAWEILHALDKKGIPLNTTLGQEYYEAIELLESCLKLNFNDRITSSSALKLDFFKEIC